jgi:hypothetical protein
MNREQRGKLKSNGIDLSDANEARKFLKTIVVGTEHDHKSMFPVRMNDGRIVDGDSATDDDIMEIVRSIAGNPQ